MGAEVVKVEAPSGDPMEIYHAGWYREMAAGQTLVRLDLKSAQGREELDRLLGEADLLISASRPAAMERLGLGWAALHQHIPVSARWPLSVIRLPAKMRRGTTLPIRHRWGSSPLPTCRALLLADMAGAEMTLSSALALLLQRERGGEAGYAEVALSEAAASLAEPLRYGCTSPGALLGGGIPEYNIYKTADGWIAVAALEPHFKKRLEDALAIATPDQYQNAFAGQSSAYWQEWGQQQDVPIETVR